MTERLNPEKIMPQAKQAMEHFHNEVVEEVKQAIEKNEWVVVGMRQNVVVKMARKFLAEKKINYKYIEHGNYFSMWKPRLAIKLWSGWPTFPQVFHKGKLVGGCADLKKYLGEDLDSAKKNN